MKKKSKLKKCQVISAKKMRLSQMQMRKEKKSKGAHIYIYILLYVKETIKVILSSTYNNL